jgi:hypothetical protein
MKLPVLCYCWTHNWELARTETPADEPANIKYTRTSYITPEL